MAESLSIPEGFRGHHVQWARPTDSRPRPVGKAHPSASNGPSETDDRRAIRRGSREGDNDGLDAIRRSRGASAAGRGERSAGRGELNRRDETERGRPERTGDFRSRTSPLPCRTARPERRPASPGRRMAPKPRTGPGVISGSGSPRCRTNSSDPPVVAPTVVRSPGAARSSTTRPGNARGICNGGARRRPWMSPRSPRATRPGP